MFGFHFIHLNVITDFMMEQLDLKLLHANQKIKKQGEIINKLNERMADKVKIIKANKRKENEQKQREWENKDNPKLQVSVRKCIFSLYE